MKQSYAEDIFFSFTLQILENGKSLILIPIIAKTLGASGYGIWVQVKIGIAFLCPLLLLGLSNGVARFLPGSSKKVIRDGIFSSFTVGLITGTGLALLIVLLKGTIQKYMGAIPDSGLLIKALALLCIVEPLNSFCVGYFNSFRRIKTLLRLFIFDTIFEFIPVFWFAYNGFGISAVIFSFVCGRLLMVGLKSLLIFREVGLGSFKIDIIINYIKFGLPLIWATIFFYLSNYLDRYLIGYFYSAKEVGVYSLAYTIGYIVVLISVPLDRILVPTITEHWNQGRITVASNYFNNTLRYVLILIIPIIVFLSATGKEIVRMLSTPEFFSGVYIIPIMLITFLIFEIGIFYHRIALLTYNSNIIMKVFAIAAVINIVLNVMLVPKFSITGAAVSLFITYGTLFLIFYKLANIKINTISFDWLLLIRCLLATALGYLLLLLNKGGLYKLLLNIALSILSYFVFLRIFGIIGIREWIFLKDFWDGIKRK